MEAPQITVLHDSPLVVDDRLDIGMDPPGVLSRPSWTISSKAMNVHLPGNHAAASPLVRLCFAVLSQAYGAVLVAERLESAGGCMAPRLVGLLAVQATQLYHGRLPPMGPTVVSWHTHKMSFVITAWVLVASLLPLAHFAILQAKVLSRGQLAKAKACPRLLTITIRSFPARHFARSSQSLHTDAAQQSDLAELWPVSRMYMRTDSLPSCSPPSSNVLPKRLFRPELLP